MRRLVVGLVALITVGALGGYAAGALTKTKSADAADGSLASLVVVRSDAQSAVDVATPFAVPSATIDVTVPAGHHDLFDIRFSGVASYPGGAAFPVNVDVSVDGIAMPPSGLPAWQAGAASPVPFQLERAIGPLAPGTYDIGIVLTGAPQNHQLVQLLGWTLLAQRTSESARSTLHGPSSA